ncbi:hypothetical protein PIB30_008867 [Stylosanthes scabra]|uniref:Uncharacterized protein n=1 Tax=Stylosanthes scabra TaxID=79078 RepID=A0ABU6Z5P8_9FABA|nr:hypothetical protein [Stylosanthes scabra]
MATVPLAAGNRCHIRRNPSSELIELRACVEAQNAAAGIVCVWSTESFVCDRIIKSDRWLLCKGRIAEQGFEYAICVVYGAHHKEEKFAFWEELTQTRELIDVPILLGVGGVPGTGGFGLVREKIYLGPKSFRMLDAWLTHGGFKEVVKDEWVKFGNLACHDKLILLKDPIRCWNKEKFGAIDLKIAEIEKEIQKVDEETEKGTTNECIMARGRALRILAER